MDDAINLSAAFFFSPGAEGSSAIPLPLTCERCRRSLTLLWTGSPIMSDVNRTVDLFPDARFAFFMHHEKGSVHEGEVGGRPQGGGFHLKTVDDKLRPPPS